MSQEVIVEDFPSIVAIKPKQGERQGLFDLFDLVKGIGFPFAPNGALFSPAGGNVDTVDV